MNRYYINEDGKIIEKSDNNGDGDVDVLDLPEEKIDNDSLDFGTRVILYNDNYHSFEEVVNQLKKAINCSDKLGFFHAYIVHTNGKSQVYTGKPKECKRVAGILREIRLKVRIEK